MAIIKLKAPSAWDTIPAGFITTAQAMSLDRIEDNFDDGSIDAALIGTVVSGNGSVVETRGLTVDFPANADAAIWYDKNEIDASAAEDKVWDSIRSTLERRFLP